ncbi:hypothetical protein [Halomonas llamarensis]|uniref:Uncharacterized protein n=1 Tax=Halomonas llamarensis TaxID=2945104 RepID=A0ABT0SVH7_9GAMM|nr:hypothetical protein [Halomonas llamarensis]MCL7931732.1 hypothetical protein [Halomonas llamarensis]
MKAAELDRKKRQIRRLLLSEYDISEAKDICRYIIRHGLWNDIHEPEARTLGRWLQSAMVVAYYRPFSGNHNTDDTLDRPSINICKKLSQEHLELHCFLKKNRNEVFAHTAADIRDLEVSVSLLAGRHSVTCSSEVSEAMFTQQTYLSIKSLFETVEELFEKEIQKIASTLPLKESF